MYTIYIMFTFADILFSGVSVRPENFANPQYITKTNEGNFMGTSDTETKLRGEQIKLTHQNLFIACNWKCQVIHTEKGQTANCGINLRFTDQWRSQKLCLRGADPNDRGAE